MLTQKIFYIFLKNSLLWILSFLTPFFFNMAFLDSKFAHVEGKEDQNVLGFVMANKIEYVADMLRLYKPEVSMSFDYKNPIPRQTVGFIDDNKAMPVNISLFYCYNTSLKKSPFLVVWTSDSRYLDYTMVEDYLKQKFPNAINHKEDLVQSCATIF